MLAYLGLAIYLAAMLRPVSPMLSFVANHDYFALERCENKNNPTLKCNGSCQMKRMVEENEKQNGHDFPVSLIHSDEIPLSIVPESGHVDEAFATPLIHQTKQTAILGKKMNAEVWRPPCQPA